MTIVESRLITGGVDTHADTHVAAALDPIGGLLGVEEFPVTPAGYARLLGWLGGFGTVGLVGIEGTGSYGAGLARHVTAAGIRVVEVDRSDRQDRRRQGKSDPLDAVSAARAAQSGRARGAPKGRDGAVEAIRALMVAKRSARSERTQTINQARALIVTGPDHLRARFAGHTVAALVSELATLRPRPGNVVGYATRIALRELGRRAEFLDSQLERLDELIVPLVTARAPGLLALHGVGPDTAALLLIAAGDHPARLRSEAAWAHLCAAAKLRRSGQRYHNQLRILAIGRRVWNCRQVRAEDPASCHLGLRVGCSPLWRGLPCRVSGRSACRINYLESRYGYLLGIARSAGLVPVLVENSATSGDLVFHAACPYSLISPASLVRRWIRVAGPGKALTFGASSGARRSMPWPWWLRPVL